MRLSIIRLITLKDFSLTPSIYQCMHGVIMTNNLNSFLVSPVLTSVTSLVVEYKWCNKTYTTLSKSQPCVMLQLITKGQ